VRANLVITPAGQARLSENAARHDLSYRLKNDGSGHGLRSYSFIGLLTVFPQEVNWQVRNVVGGGKPRFRDGSREIVSCESQRDNDKDVKPFWPVPGSFSVAP